MKEKDNPLRQKKGATVGLVICFVAAIAMVGTYTLKHYKNGMEQQLAQAEDEMDTGEKTVENSEASTQNIVVDLPQDQVLSETTLPEDQKKDGTSDATSSKSVESASSKTTALNFSESDRLLWPVDGNVLMNYSMDQTVYFSTLDQYKYNPALIISGAVGDQVMSATKGRVKSIDVTAQTGTTVTVDIGNGYELVYGQLKEVPVKTGDYVEAKTILGYLSEPTKYYSVEGCNLYFQMLKDGEPVNPLEYLEE